MARAAAMGIDLAWSDRNRSGCVALDANGRVIDEQLLSTDDEIVDWIDDLAAAESVVAIDAPLHVPNPIGRRPCESELHAVYGARGGGPHSSNRTLFTRIHGRIRGEDLRAVLEQQGFTDPWSGGSKTLFEVYPHPALIEVFGLSERLAYKKGRVAARRSGLRRLEDLLSTLDKADPPLLAERVEVSDEVRGRELKGIEDRLDARLCAWLALLWHHKGRDAFSIYGSRAEGHIAVPTAGVFG